MSKREDPPAFGRGVVAFRGRACTVRGVSFLKSSTGREVRVVHTVVGKLWVGDEHHPKARVWVLEDRTAVLVLPAAGRGVERRTEALTASSWDGGRKLLTAVTEDGQDLRLDGRGCGCNMGAVGNAGPVDGRYNIVRVRTPEWHEVSK